MAGRFAQVFVAGSYSSLTASDCGKTGMPPSAYSFPFGAAANPNTAELRRRIADETVAKGAYPF